MNNTKQELINQLSTLADKKITKVICGGSNGSILVFDIGDDAILFIESAWRLSKDNTTLAGWRDANLPKTGNLVVQIELLIGETIKTATTNNLLDLQIITRTDKQLDVFCDISPCNSDELEENWALASKVNNICYTIMSDGRIEKSVYQAH